MRSGTLASLSTVAMVAASALALVCLSVAVPEPPGRIAASEPAAPAAPVADAAPSLFVASGGLVPDAGPLTESEAGQASTHAVVAATQLGTH